MKTFVYKSENRSAACGTILHPWSLNKLDENDPHVKSLIAKGLLAEHRSVSEPEPKKKHSEKHNSKK